MNKWASAVWGFIDKEMKPIAFDGAIGFVRIWSRLRCCLKFTSFYKLVFVYSECCFWGKLLFYQQSSPKTVVMSILEASFLVSCLLHFTRFLVEAPAPWLLYSA